MAERVGFEPTLEFPLNTLSKRAPSATRPSLREGSGAQERRSAAPLNCNVSVRKLGRGGTVSRSVVLLQLLRQLVGDTHCAYSVQPRCQTGDVLQLQDIGEMGIANYLAQQLKKDD